MEAGRRVCTDELGDLLPDLLRGLEQSISSEAAADRLKEWVREGKFLHPIARYLGWSKALDVELLERLLHTSIEAADSWLVTTALGAVLRRRKEGHQNVEERIVRPALRFLNEKKDSRWIRQAWYIRPNEALLLDAQGETIELILDSLIHHPRIDHQAERVLLPLAKRVPQKALALFENRIRLGATDASPAQYRAVPHELRDLRVVFQGIENELVRTMSQLYEHGDYGVRHAVTRFIRSVSPDFSSELQVSLLALLNPNKPWIPSFIVDVMREYDGNEKIHDLCKQVVDFGSSDDLLVAIRIAILSTGVVAGTFGLVDAYKAKRAAIETWLDDPREKVRKFAVDFIPSIDNYIATEQQRAEEELAKRKLNFGAPDDGEEDDVGPQGQ